MLARMMDVARENDTGDAAQSLSEQIPASFGGLAEGRFDRR